MSNTDSPDSNSRAARPVAVVTGASSGIGAIYAARLAARGHDLILVARRGDLLQALAERLHGEYKVDVDTLVADLADTTSLDRVAETLAANARIDILVNNAGTATLGPISKADSRAQDAMIDLNVRSLTRLSAALLPRFIARNRGAIINIGSVLGFHTLPTSGIYSATKAYVMAFTRGLQTETAGTKVKVQLLMPSATVTDIWEKGGVPLSAVEARAMSAEAMVDAALVGLDAGEDFTLPSVNDAQLWSDYDDARAKLFAASQTKQVAERYQARRAAA